MIALKLLAIVLSETRTSSIKLQLAPKLGDFDPTIFTVPA